MKFACVTRGSCGAIVALLLCAATALAQTSQISNPADPDAAVPQLKYESVFSDYQSFQEQKSDSWKQVNKEVAQGAASLNAMPGDTMPGMASRSGDASTSKAGAGARHTHSPKHDMKQSEK